MKPPTFKSASYQGSDFTDGKNLLLVWGATGEQEWSPGLTTGILIVLGVVLTLFDPGNNSDDVFRC